MWTLRRPATEDTTHSYRQLQRPRYCLWGTTQTDADRWHGILCRSASVLVRQSAVGVTLWSGWVPPWSAWRLLCLIRGYKFSYTIRHPPRRSGGEKNNQFNAPQKNDKITAECLASDNSHTELYLVMWTEPFICASCTRKFNIPQRSYSYYGGSWGKKPKSKNKYRNRL